MCMLYGYIYRHIYIYIYICIHDIYIYIHMYTYNTYIYIYICIHTYVYIRYRLLHSICIYACSVGRTATRPTGSVDAFEELDKSADSCSRARKTGVKPSPEAKPLFRVRVLYMVISLILITAIVHSSPRHDGFMIHSAAFNSRGKAVRVDRPPGIRGPRVTVPSAAARVGRRPFQEQMLIVYIRLELMYYIIISWIMS